jgi:ABC-type polysaccharide/polyol phosphate transport system ATPase subunit
MRGERAQRRVAQGKGSFKLEEANRSGRRVAEARGIAFRYDNETVVDDFSTIIQRGDRVGIVGSNGVGKTTVIKLLLGELTPDEGDVLLGTQLEIAYSDQLRGELDPEKNLIDNVCGGQEFIEINGQPLSKPYPAVRSIERFSRVCSLGLLISSSSMSRQMISISRHWSFWRKSCWSSRAPLFWSVTIVTSSIKW